MQPTKEILELLAKRTKYGELATVYESRVIDWCDKHGVYVDDITFTNGCMLVTEPLTYERLFLERIKQAN